MATTVTLGPYTLQSFEVPAVIHFGGRQRLVVHDLPGGGRVIDALGGSDSDIIFSGIISGNDADTKVQLLDALRISGLSVPLIWSDQYFIVILAEAHFDFRKSWWIPYEVRCTVQSNLVYGAVSTALNGAINIITDLATASGLLDFPLSSLTHAETAVASSGGTTYGTAAYTQSFAAVTAAQTDVQSQLSSAGNTLPAFDLSLSGVTPQTSALNLNGATANAQQVAQRSAAQGYIGHALASLAHLGG